MWLVTVVTGNINISKAFDGKYRHDIKDSLSHTHTVQPRSAVTFTHI